MNPFVKRETVGVSSWEAKIACHRNIIDISYKKTNYLPMNLVPKFIGTNTKLTLWYQLWGLVLVKLWYQLWALVPVIFTWYQSVSELWYQFWILVPMKGHFGHSWCDTYKASCEDLRRGSRRNYETSYMAAKGRCPSKVGRENTIKICD